MSKEWILNAATNRWQFNFKRNVGAVTAEIRGAEPENVEEWREFYFSNVRAASHIEELGRRLYIKISEVMRAELETISEQDCIDYLFQLVIDRTFDGYITEKTTVYEQLEKLLGERIEPAPDDWDRGYNVDFFIRAGNFFVGLQIKPVTFYNIADYAKWRDIHENSGLKFKKNFGGEVFIVVSIKQGDKKAIANPEILPLIRAEIDLLRAQS